MDSLNQSTEKVNELEDKITFSFSVTSPGGFDMTFTVLSRNKKPLLEKAALIEKKLLDKGYKPQEKRKWSGKAAPKEYAAHACPKCTSKVLLKKNKEGKPYEVCETSKFDPSTKTSTGCPYFKWLEVKENK